MSRALAFAVVPGEPLPSRRRRFISATGRSTSFSFARSFRSAWHSCSCGAGGTIPRHTH